MRTKFHILMHYGIYFLSVFKNILKSLFWVIKYPKEGFGLKIALRLLFRALCIFYPHGYVFCYFLSRRNDIIFITFFQRFWMKIYLPYPMATGASLLWKSWSMYLNLYQPIFSLKTICLSKHLIEYYIFLLVGII